MARDGAFYTYMMASASGVLYVGVTNNLVVRVAEHKEGVLPGFTQRYHVDRLVWYEPHSSIRAAIAREKEIKGWKRIRKVHLIEERNPRWCDLSLGPATVELRTRRGLAGSIEERFFAPQTTLRMTCPGGTARSVGWRGCNCKSGGPS